MLIAITIVLGVAAAGAAIVVAYRLVPPLWSSAETMPDDMRRAVLAEGEADLVDAIRRAEQERRDEIDALRQIMLRQRLEISKLRREGRERRERQARANARAHELEMRRRRAGNEARHFSELPVAALLGDRTKTY